MSHDAQFVRVKKLASKDVIRIAGRHNLREIQAEIGADGHIDAERIRLNRVLEGPDNAAEIAALAGRLMEEAGVGALRKDAVRGLEIVVSLPSTSSVNQPVFFDDALAWVKTFYGVPVLSAVIHNDEAAPHVHVLLLPLLDGRMQGSDLVGNRTRLQAMQSDFYLKVGQRYGLIRPKAARRLSAATRNKSASLILSALQSNPDLMDRACIESELMALFGRDPEPLLNAMGLSIPHPPKSNKSFVEIMTKPCGLEKTIGFGDKSKPIGFDIQAEEKEQTLSCVGFAPKSPPVSAHKPSNRGDFTRCRDEDQAGQWDDERGEFVPLQTPVKKQSACNSAFLADRLALNSLPKRNRRPLPSSPYAIRLAYSADRPPLRMTA